MGPWRMLRGSQYQGVQGTPSALLRINIEGTSEKRLCFTRPVAFYIKITGYVLKNHHIFRRVRHRQNYIVLRYLFQNYKPLPSVYQDQQSSIL